MLRGGWAISKRGGNLEKKTRYCGQMCSVGLRKAIKACFSGKKGKSLCSTIFCLCIYLCSPLTKLYLLPLYLFLLRPANVIFVVSMIIFVVTSTSLLSLYLSLLSFDKVLYLFRKPSLTTFRVRLRNGNLETNGCYRY